MGRDQDVSRCRKTNKKFLGIAGSASKSALMEPGQANSRSQSGRGRRAWGASREPFAGGGRLLPQNRRATRRLRSLATQSRRCRSRIARARIRSRSARSAFAASMVANFWRPRGPQGGVSRRDRSHRRRIRPGSAGSRESTHSARWASSSRRSTPGTRAKSAPGPRGGGPGNCGVAVRPGSR
jgi:hypothetical protein